MKILVLACAEEELTEAVDYYNGQCPGLGYEFAAEVQHVFIRIIQYPTAWPVFSTQTRRCLIDRFPYGVLYLAHQDHVVVAGVMHLKRDPKKWQQRCRGVPEGQSMSEPGR